MITVVNGFVCSCCSDVAKAKRGEDPAKHPGDQPGDPGKDPLKIELADPAVTFGGSLNGRAANAASVNGANAVAPAAPAGNPVPTVNLLI